MSALRRRLRAFAALWFVVQAATLLVFVPLNCCAAHGAPTAASDRSSSIAGAHCVMHGSNTGCVWHEDDAEESGHSRLMMGCAHPASALLSVLAIQGVLPGACSLSVTAAATVAVHRRAAPLIARVAPPEVPPPRL